ncbi:MAG: TonB-dependent receptor [Verrucomicrobia bacterium]|nr:TonB-dependent receptor [Verrucomicrobiota bacterium]
MALWLLLGASVFASEADLLPASVVLADRRTGPGVMFEWSREEILEASPRSIDEMLATEPAFSLYRRQSAIFGNPTSAGVSLRNTGATAASRTLVLLDGIPQNDPFGAWVNWARYDALTLESARIVSSAPALLWGNQASAGVIQLNGASPFDERHSFRLAGGSHGSMGASTAHAMSNEERTRAVSFAAFGFHTDGFFALNETQRGAVDRRLETEFFGEEIKFAWLLAPGVTLEPKFSHYYEHRSNGTELSENSTDAFDFSLRLTSEDAAVSWQAVAWHQRREFESIFTSVSDDRSFESIALNQFDVPGLGTGGAWSAAWGDEEAWSFQSGADFRWLSGETNEDVGIFRRREAGGEQWLVGVFVGSAWRMSERDRFQINVRADHWAIDEGRRIETSLASGALLRDDRYEDRNGVEPSASLEWIHEMPRDVESRVALGSGFRLPTLNELYRPFRVRDDIVEANAELDPERFLNAEAGLDWKANDEWKFGAAVFHHWISDAIANVPVTDPAKLKDLFPTLPSGGTGSVRDNVDEARVAGFEGSAEWLPHESVTLALRGLWSKTEFSSSPDQPLLEGKPFPQSPDLRVIADAEWSVLEGVSLFGGVEYGASQFDDALATRVIPDYTSVRLGVMRKIGNATLQVRMENLFDEEIVTGFSSNGLRTLAAPRSLWASLEWDF